MPSPARIRWAKVRVLTVAIAAVVILMTLFYLLTGGTLFEEKVSMFMYIPDATGLGPDSPVRVDGIGVGKVDKVALSGFTDPLRIVKVTMKIERKDLSKIPADSWAQLTSETLIGDKFVDISSGRSTQTLQPNTQLTYREQPDMMKSLDLQQFQARLRIVDAMLTDIEQGRSRLGQFIKGDQAYKDLRSRIAEVQAGFHEAASVTSAVGREIYGDPLYQRLRRPIADLDLSLAKLQSGQGSAGQFLTDTSTYDKLAANIADLRKTTQNIASSPFMTSDAMYTSWNQGIQSMMRKVDEFNTTPLLATTVVYDNLNGMAKELAVTLKDFRENPKKYLRLKVF